MSGISTDFKPNTGLANSLSNIFKLADVNGLKWTRYIGPNSLNLEAPKDDPVLNSYAKLLNEGFACSWRRVNPCTDGTSGESKDLWVFYFTELPDISDKLAEGLTEEGSGNWEEGMNQESTTMLYRSLHNIIERSLMSETFLPLGKWFAKADSTMATDGSSRGCFLCSFSFFVHAHRYICASVAMRAGPHLQPLLPSHINQALASSTGLQVILSPSGLNAVMTGHTYKLSDGGIREILEEWKLFYPRRCSVDPSPNLPAAIEVMLGGVRMRYPSQFVFIYHGSENPGPSPPPSTLDQRALLDSIQHSWDSAGCIDAVQQQKEVSMCKCQEQAPSRSRRPSVPSGLPLRGARNRYEPYPTSSAPMRELATPGSSLHLANTPSISFKKRLSKPGLPRYANPDLASPAIPRPLSPSKTSALLGKSGAPLPTISLPAAASIAGNPGGAHSFTTTTKHYDQSQILVGSSKGSGRGEELSDRAHRELEWWDSLNLPESKESLASLQLPKQEHRRSLQLGMASRKTSSSQDHPPLSATKLTNGLKTELMDSGELGEGEGEAMLGEPELKSKATIDLMEEKAVQIDASCPLDSIFASDEEDETLEGGADGRADREERMDTSQQIKGLKMLSAVDAGELSRIYPTPPSVELPDSEAKYGEDIKMEDRADSCGNMAAWDSTSGLCDDFYVPPEFEPLPFSDLPGLADRLPDCLMYTSSTSDQTNSSQAVGSGCETSSVRTGSSSKSEPQKFIFPPPSLIGSRSQSRDALNLPLQRPAHMYTPQTVTSSPAFPHPKTRYPLSTPTMTPLASPFDPLITPTPLSANTNRLMPVLPEAHALYINLSLLDSALGSNFSETMPFSAGPLISTLQSFISKRIKRDSVADGLGAMDTGVGSTTDLLGYQDEKPMMTFGIADYPSLGFREELGMSNSAGGNWDSPFGVMSKVLPDNTTSSDPLDIDSAHSTKLVKFVELLQDYTLTLCYNGYHDNQSAPPTHSLSHGQLLLQLLDGFEDIQQKLSSRLYHSHSVVSAIRNANQLIVNSGRKGSMAAMGGQLANKPTVSKEDNSGAWILDLLTLPTKFMTKRLKDLRMVFQNSFHHAPCLKFTTKGPLSLKDLQQLAPSQTAIGDDCLPLPLPPMLVGYDHNWLSVSPLALPAWDKMMFEPYSTRKNLLYMVVVPPTVSTHNTVPVLKKYFKELSITFKNCNLGQHIPLEGGGMGEGGVVLISSDASSTKGSTTADPNTDTRHSSESAQLRRFCKKVLGSYLAGLPTNDKDLLNSLSSPSQERPTPTHPSLPTTPISIVLYILCENPLNPGSNSRPRPPGSKLKDLKRSKDLQKCFEVLLAFSELLSSEDIPESIQNKLVLQLLDPKELLGPFSGQSGQLRSMAFSVYTRCSCDMKYDQPNSLTSFGPTAHRQTLEQMFYTRCLRSPAYVLSPEAPLSSTGPIVGTQIHPILFDPEVPVLFCGYCVSPDRRWLLVVCCDRQGELLNTAVLGIPSCINIDQSCSLALKQLWDFVVSVIAGTVYKWSIVITRFGKPSTSEITHWPTIIPNDGLVDLNNGMRGDCNTCKISSSLPRITNVIIVSVQPERNIQLFPSNDPNPSVSHVIVLPQDPRNADSALTPGMAEAANEDFFNAFGGQDTTAGGDFDPGIDIGGIDIAGELSGINVFDEIQNQMPYAAPVEDTGPKAVGYLISTSPPGELPNEFWGHEKPQNFCSIFKVLLHCHRTSLERSLDSPPQETLGSILLCFDALSWLTMDQLSKQRKSCLPLHLFVLSKLYHLFKLLEQPH